MNGINDVIDINDFDNKRCFNRNGFVFSAIKMPLNIADTIIVRNPISCDCWSPKYSFSEHSLEKHIELINEYKIEKAIVIAENIDFLVRCPTLKYIKIFPADTAPENFDYSPLYKMPNIEYLSCITQYGGCAETKSTVIDYTNMKDLVELHVRGAGHLNYDKVCTLRSLNIWGDKSLKDLNRFENLKNLKDLDICFSSLTNLDGISVLENLQALSVSYCRSLQDITELSCISQSLRLFSVRSCPKISDFSCLDELINLEYLELYSNNELESLTFLNKLNKLKIFGFSAYIKDGDLTPCLRIPYVYCERNRKGYNLKDKDLPKNKTAPWSLQ